MESKKEVLSKYFKNANERELTVEDIYLAMDEYASQQKGGRWVREKPDFKEECVFITATDYIRNREPLMWDYKVWQLKWLEGENDKGESAFYLGLLNGDGEEYGDLEDLVADRYFIFNQPHETSTPCTCDDKNREGWLNIEDGLPETNEVVWIYRKSGHIYIGYRDGHPLSTNKDASRDCHWYGTPCDDVKLSIKKDIRIYTNFSDITVSHWMPFSVSLPDPPKQST